MEDVRRNLMVGIFVLAGLVILATLAVLFGSGPQVLLGGERYPLYIHFERAAGIREGNAVTIGGIEVGHVDEVGFVNRSDFHEGVYVRILVDREYQIPTDSVATTIEPGLGQGRPPIELFPGTSPERLSPGDKRWLKGEIKGAMASLIPEDVVDSAKESVNEVRRAAEALKKLVEPRLPEDVDRPGGPVGNLASAATRADATLKHFNEVLGDPQVKSRIRAAVDNFHAISEDGKVLSANLREASQDARRLVTEGREVVARAGDAVDTFDEELTAVGREARTMLQNGSRFATTLSEIALSAQQGEGTLGRLLRDPKLYEALLVSVQRVAAAFERIEQMAREWQERGVRMRY